MALFPPVAAALVSIPRPVAGAALLFSSCFILTNALQIITSRLLDARKTFIIGLSLTLSLSRDIFPDLYRDLPDALQPMVASGLIIGVIAALLLNAIFRIGVKTRVSVMFTPGADEPETIRSFLEQQGAHWGARRDVIERAIFGATQAIESISEHCNPEGPITIEVSFDEFNLDVQISYRG